MLSLSEGGYASRCWLIPLTLDKTMFAEVEKLRNIVLRERPSLSSNLGARGGLGVGVNGDPGFLRHEEWG